MSSATTRLRRARARGGTIADAAQRLRVVIAAACICAMASACAAVSACVPASAFASASDAAARAARPPSLSVRAAILTVAGSGQRLYGIDADKSVAIASATKLMTALVTLEHERLGKVFADPDYYPDADDSQIGLAPGERMTVHDLMLAMLLPSADDAAEDLAYNVGRGSVARFVGMMNARARQLGLVHTHYSTPIGLDTPGNYSSASDLVKLADYLRKTQPFFVRAVSRRSAVLRSGDHVRVIANRNDLVGRVPWINGVKTGHTLDAGYVLVSSATRDGMTLLGAVLGTDSESSRDANTLALQAWGFAHFRRVTPVRAGTVLARPAARAEPGQHPEAVAAGSYHIVIERGTRITTRVVAPRQLTGPLRWHAVVGHVVVLAGGRPVARMPLLLAHALPAPPTPMTATRFITRPSTLLSLFVLFGAAMVALGVRRRLRTRQAGKERAEPA
jgi:D-alanyl-D-alanine carboxypeptidase (penicillin-binding protein 5/6)